MFRPPKALPGRSLAELGSLVPSKLPQGSLELRDSPPSERGPPAWGWPGRLRRPLKARFDRRFDCCKWGDLGGEAMFETLVAMDTDWVGMKALAQRQGVTLTG